MSALSEPPRLCTGIPSLDEILFGGLPKNHVYLVEGDPGTGKTTLAMQFILGGKRAGERCLYVTLAESKTELEIGAQSHKWSLDGVPIAEFLPEEANLNGDDQYTVFHPSEVELATTIKKLIAEIERVNPERLVIDSLTEFRLLAQDAIWYRRQLLALKTYLADRNTTVLLLDDRTSNRTDLQVHSIVHGIFRLENLPRSYGVNRRRIEISKIRGIAYRQGYHDYTVGLEGVVIYLLRMIPKRKDKDLLNGFVWVDMKTFRIQRIEGTPAKKPSWWLKDVDITLQYTDMDGLWLPTYMTSTAVVRLAGSYVLTGEAVGVQLSAFKHPTRLSDESAALRE